MISFPKNKEWTSVDDMRKLILKDIDVSRDEEDELFMRTVIIDFGESKSS